VDVSIVPEAGQVTTDGEYRIEKFRCGGKGGQNVNKVETGVRVIHIPTRTVTQSTEERSQFRNKQRAMERMGEKLADLQQKQQERQADAAWMEHYRIVRGNLLDSFLMVFIKLHICHLVHNPSALLIPVLFYSTYCPPCPASNR